MKKKKLVCCFLILVMIFDLQAKKKQIRQKWIGCGVSGGLCVLLSQINLNNNRNSNTSMNAEQARELLGLKPGFSLQECDRAYRQKALKSHPDKGGDEELMKNINQAKEILNTTSNIDSSSTNLYIRKGIRFSFEHCFIKNRFYFSYKIYAEPGHIRNYNNLGFGFLLNFGVTSRNRKFTIAWIVSPIQNIMLTVLIANANLNCFKKIALPLFYSSGVMISHQLNESWKMTYELKFFAGGFEKMLSEPHSSVLLLTIGFAYNFAKKNRSNFS